MEFSSLSLILLLIGFFHCSLPQPSVKPTVRVNRTSVYTGDSVTLTCDLQPADGWKWTEYYWFRNYLFVKNTSSNTYSVELSNSRVIKFNCAAFKGKHDVTDLSDPVQIRVSKKPKPTVMINPGGDVFRGEPVNLTCTIQDDEVSEWQYSWYKDGSDPVLSTDQVYTISHVTDTHSGNYTCRGSGDRGSSHMSDAVTLTVSVLSETINDLLKELLELMEWFRSVVLEIM